MPVQEITAAPLNPPSHAPARSSPRAIEAGTGPSVLPASTPPSQVVPEQAPPARRPDIAFITGGGGGGHVAPAEAIKNKLDEGGQYPTTLVNVPGVRNFVFGRSAMDHVLYKISNTRFGGAFASKARRLVLQRPVYANVKKALEEHRDAKVIVVNHRIMWGAVRRYAGKDQQLVLITADPDKIHEGWLTGLFRMKKWKDRPTPAVMVPHKVGFDQASRAPAAHVIQTGYPVRTAFEEVSELTHEQANNILRDPQAMKDTYKASPADARVLSDLPADKKLIVMSRGGGWAEDLALAQLKVLVKDERMSGFHIVVADGANGQRLLDFVAENNLADRVTLLGRCKGETMAILGRAAHRNLIKAGGASIHEAYAVQRPFVIGGRLSGAEHANSDHVIENQTGLVALKKEEWADAVFGEIPPDKEAAMLRNQRQFEIVGAAQKMASELNQIANKRIAAAAD